MVSKQGSILGGCVDIWTIKFNWNLDLDENKIKKILARHCLSQ